MIWGAARRRARVDAVVAACEERAATTYASPMSRVGHLAETRLAASVGAHAGAPGSVVVR